MVAELGDGVVDRNCGLARLRKRIGANLFGSNLGVNLDGWEVPEVGEECGDVIWLGHFGGFFCGLQEEGAALRVAEDYAG